MKTRKLLVLGLIPAMIACGGGEEGTEETQEEVAEETCTYSYDENSTVLTWTAFKLSEKVGVDGTFDQINVTASESEDMFGVLSGATFEIPVSSINSQDAVRDGKIKNSFFGNMAESEMLSGTINSIDANKASVNIVMNGKGVDYDGEVSVDGETITMKTTIDILDFEGQVAIDSLGVVCEEKHTGPDGVNKLWSDVNIAVKTTLKKECK
ncbi:YceI family protein [Paracrocinitomix mangrovi]|uniref:YceI family protein n=1 Tax=Paracrocinitomix mangrovi TaxID=2862509 RepID=UPI001C8ED45A|nr:YceI family protein [Paracrocinitomix mangrovi]UKN00137.1 YceI family protein [Paracrocinitomix mangrovi]